VLCWFARSGLIEPDAVREMLAPENSFSLDARMRVVVHDRTAIERLLSYFLSLLEVRFECRCCGL
jgi:hypothetical protein